MVRSSVWPPLLMILAGAWSAAPMSAQATSRTQIDQRAVDLADGLSAREAVLVSLERNPELLAARKGLAVAQASVALAAQLPSPELRFGKSDLDFDSGAGISRRTNVALRWFPPRPGELGNKREIARSKVEEFSDGVAAAEHKLAAEVRLLHSSLVLIEEQIKIADQAVAVREAIVKTIKAQLESGTKSALDRSAAELTLADARAAARHYRSEQRSQRSRFAGKLGMPLSFDTPLQREGDVLAFTPLAAPRQKLVATALNNRMELREAAARCAQAELSVKAVRRERYPWSSFVQVERRSGRVQDPPTWGFAIGVEIPVFSVRSPELKQFSAALEQCRFEQEAVRAGIVAEVEEAAVRLESEGRDLQQAQDEIALLAEQNLALSRAALQEGLVDAVEPLLAQAHQLAARQAYLTGLMQIRALEVDLDRALGISFY